MMTSNPQNNQLESLQALRAIAALMVILFHMNVYTLPQKMGASQIWNGFNMGYAGVEIFFVLSGFIIFHVHRKEFNNKQRYLPYFFKRITRVYPFFWIVLIGVVLLRVIDGEPMPDIWSLFVSITLLPFPDHQLLGVQWTLSYEMLFYLIFSISIVNAAAGISIMSIWFLICIIGTAVGYSGPGSNFLFSPYNVLFLLGIITSYIANKWRIGGFLSLLLGTVFFLGIGFLEVLAGYDYFKPYRTILFGIAAMIIVASLVSLDKRGRVKVPRWLVFLGDASYSIYLVHITTMSIVALLIQTTGLDTLPPALIGVILFVIAVLSGAAAHILVEKPIISAIRRKSFRVSTIS